MGRKIKPAMIFGNHMVLQRQKAIRIWGTLESDENEEKNRIETGGQEKSSVQSREITVELAGNSVTVPCEDGKWKAVFPPLEACEGQTLTITSGDEKIRFTDIAVGEVWVAGGQSNMEFYLRYDAERDRAEENRKIRMFDYPEVSFEGQLERGDYSDFGFWRVCTEENFDFYFAVAYYFAQRLQKKYQVPVGIVGCNWGGTPACTWTDAKYLENTEGDVWLSDYRKTMETLDIAAYENAYDRNPWHYRQKPFEDEINEAVLYGVKPDQMETIMKKLMEREGGEPLPEGPRSEHRPGGLCDLMVKKTAPYTVRGVIWYQGESDDRHPEVYHTVLERLIRCWRDLWQDELPFLMVQLAPFHYWDQEKRDCFPIIRREQEIVSRQVPGVWLTSIMDVGMEYDIHPKQKRPVGERLALLAEGHVYGEDILCDPPECTGIAADEGGIVLKFANAGEGLHLSGNEITAMEVLCDGNTVENYETELNGDKVKVLSPVLETATEICIRFAEMDFCEVNLYNSAGIPAKPFTKGMMRG